MPPKAAKPEHVPWPSIDNLPGALAGRILARRAALAAVAVIVQRRWRAHRRSVAASTAASTPADAASAAASAATAGAAEAEAEAEAGAEAGPFFARSAALLPVSFVPQGGNRASGRVIPTRFALERAKALNSAVAELLTTPAVVGEKLDGTNVGVTDEGLRLGRRHALPGGGGVMYQRTPLDVVASADKITALRDALLQQGSSGQEEGSKEEGEPASEAALPEGWRPRLAVYGELQCNPNKFGYQQRALGSVWRAFGARMWVERIAQQDDDDDVGGGGTSAAAAAATGAGDDDDKAAQETASRFAALDALRARLLAGGVWVTGAAGAKADRLTLPLSPRMQELMRQLEIETVPVLSREGGGGDAAADASDVSAPVAAPVEGGTVTVQAVIPALLDRMLNNALWEGVVLHMPSQLLKWKTGAEDGSRSVAELESVLRLPEFMTFPQEREAMTQLLRVAANQPPPKPRKNKGGGQKNQGAAAGAGKEAAPPPPPPAYEPEVLERAIDSALTKFDAPEVYFAEKGTFKPFAATIGKEVTTDLECTTREQRSEVMKAVNIRLGNLFGRWKREQAALE